MTRPFALILAVAALSVSAATTARAEDYFAHAQKLIAAGNLRGAKIELQNAVKSNPKDGAAAYALGKIDFVLGNPVAAAEEARAAKANGYDQGKSVSLLLETYLAEGRPGQLLKDFPKAEGAPDVAARIDVGRGRAEMALGELDQAAADFAAAKRVAPNSPDPLLAEADLALARRDIAGAKRNVDAALALDPHSDEALVRHAQILLATGQPKKAVEILDAVAVRAPENIVARLMDVQALLAVGQDAAAGAKLESILTVVPGSGQGLYLKAVISARAQDYKGAAHTLQKLSPIMGRIPDAYYLQAQVLAHLGQLKQAQESVRRFVGHVPGNPAGIYLLADLDLRTGDVKGALAALNGLPAAERDSPAAIELLGRAHGLIGDFQAAQKNFEQVVKLAPNAAAPRAALGAVQLGLGNPAEAIVEFQQALDLRPNDVATRRRLILTALSVGRFDVAQKNLAILKKQQGDTAENGNLEGLLKLAEVDLPAAHAQFAAVVAKYPKFIPAIVNLARVNALEGHPEKSKKLMAGILSKDPANPQALQALTRALMAENKLDEAAKLLTRAHNAAPANVSVVANLALLDIRMKKAKEALTLLGQSSTLSQHYPALLQGIEAQADLALGDTKKARATLRTLLEAAPGDVGALLLLTRILIQEKNYAGAQAAVAKGLEAEPSTYALMQAMVGVKFAEGGLAAGLKEAARLASDPAHLPAARALAGDLDMATKHPHAAVQAYVSALKASPYVPALTLRYTAALETTGQWEKARTVLSQYIGQHPETISMRLALSGLEISTGHLDAAAKQLKAVLARDGNNVDALNNLAWVDQKLGRPEARNLAKRAYFLSPNGHTADTLGWILVKEHEDAAGVPLLHQAHAALPGSATITYHLAAALEATGDGKAASELLTALVASKADFPEKAAARTLLAKIPAKP